MLSEQEYQDVQWKLNNIPPQITGKQRQHYRQTLKKQLKEHEYASKYEPFEPLPYFIYLINRTTSTNILNQIIKTTTTTTTTHEFILDTESVIIPYQPNKPVLIQIQILLPHRSSMILIFEMSHLPREHENKFSLIKQLFNIILSNNKIIYIWGNINELLPFTKFNLFTDVQCQLPNVINFQKKFQENWQRDHPHKPTTTSFNDSDNECLCEACIGHLPTNVWAIQDAVAFQLHEWLDKRVTKSPFDIGLDPELFHMNEKQLEYRKRLVTYAANDCLCIQRLIIQSELQKSYSSSMTTTTIKKTEDNEIEIISSDDEEVILTRPLSIESDIAIKPTPKQKLSEQERKIIHNRKCTLKQRKRLYKYEIICRDIDRRFKITNIKTILRENSIEFCAVNTVKSSSNHTSLFIGIKNPQLLSKYEEKIKNLFSTENYNRLNQKQYKTNSDHDRHHYHKHH